MPRRRSLPALILALSLGSPAADAQGQHDSDIQPRLENGKVMLNARLFEGDFGDVRGGPYRTDNPGFDADAAKGAFGAGHWLWYEGLNSLRFWNGSAWGAPAAGETLRLDDVLGSTSDPADDTIFGGAGVSKPLGLIGRFASGELHQHLDFSVRTSAGEPGGTAGAYWITLRLIETAPDSTAPVSTPSRPFHIVFNRGLDEKGFETAFASLPIPTEHRLLGVYNPGKQTFLLHRLDGPGRYLTAPFQTGGKGARHRAWRPLLADWDGDGVATVGLYDPRRRTFQLRNRNTEGAADLGFEFQGAGKDWLPIAGDWNGDGVATVGLYDPRQGVFHLRNAHGAGATDLTFEFQGADRGWLPVAGDWDGDGLATVGLYDPKRRVFHLRNTHGTGAADLRFEFRGAGRNWLPVAGDWDGDGAMTVGLYDPRRRVFHLRNRLDSGPADTTQAFEPAQRGWKAVAG